MDNKAQINIGGIVMLVILIIVSLVLITEIFNQQAVMTTKNPIVNETINIASARMAGANINTSLSNFTVLQSPNGTWKQTQPDCYISAVSYGNATGDFVVTTDYILYPSLGIINVLNTSTTVSSTGNTTYIDYTYCPNGYITDGGTRSITTLIGLISVIALFVVVAWRSEIADMLDFN